ncbi:MAG: hypothetical protein DHS80DRAFT_14181 [Piptocephalis tieghemiana]|nr:MAG: hypothetical protein DHS80DRAFT_14181 [Piptocephalis tieghemiana]
MFGCLAAGRLVQTEMQQVEETKWIVSLPDARSINHLVVFLLGTMPFPQGYAATVHLEWPGQPWRYLGILSNEKPSAIFRIRGTGAVPTSGTTILQLASTIPPPTTTQTSESGESRMSSGGSLVPRSSSSSIPSAQGVVQALLKHLYNYASSFITTNPTAEEIQSTGLTGGWIPARVFQDWFTTVERKVRTNPAFLSSMSSGDNGTI